MPVRGLAKFMTDTKRIVREMQRAHFEDQAQLCEYSIRLLVERSPVVTGSYRASHVVAEGAGAPTTIVWSSRNRPERAIQKGSRELTAPASESVHAAVLRRAEPFQRLWLWNDVRPHTGGESYAGEIEYGSADREPKLVYGRTSDDAAAQAVTLAQSADARFRARP